MGKITKLTDSNGQIQYPVTLAKAVVCENINNDDKILLDDKFIETCILGKYLFHNVAAFNNLLIPTYYTSTDGINFIEAECDYNLFAEKDYGSIEILNDIIKASRWSFNSINLSYSYISKILISVPWFNTPCNWDINIEISTDGKFWQNVFNKTNCILLNKYFIGSFDKLGSCSYFRVTISKHNINESGVLKIASIRLLTNRNGNQGFGKEYEFPYSADGKGNITAWRTNTQNLGSKTKQWKEVYAKHFYENGVPLSDIYVNNEAFSQLFGFLDITFSNYSKDITKIKKATTKNVVAIHRAIPVDTKDTGMRYLYKNKICVRSNDRLNTNNNWVEVINHYGPNKDRIKYIYFFNTINLHKTFNSLVITIPEEFDANRFVTDNDYLKSCITFDPIINASTGNPNFVIENNKLKCIKELDIHSIKSAISNFNKSINEPCQLNEKHYINTKIEKCYWRRNSIKKYRKTSFITDILLRNKYKHNRTTLYVYPIAPFHGEYIRSTRSAGNHTVNHTGKPYGIGQGVAIKVVKRFKNDQKYTKVIIDKNYLT